MSIIRHRFFSVFFAMLLLTSIFASMVLELPVSSGSSSIYYGNKQKFLGGATVSMSAATRKVSIDFTANYSKSVQAVAVYISSVTGTSPFYRLGLQYDVNGLPNGTYVNKAVAYLKPTATLWNQAKLNASAALTKGAVYHLVMDYWNGTVNTSNFVTVTYDLNRHGFYGFDSSPDSAQNLHSSNVVSWSGTEVSATPWYFLNFTDGSAQGETVQTNMLTTGANVWGTSSRRVGEQFLPNSTLTVGSLSVALSTYGSPADNLYFTVRNNTGGADMVNATFVTKANAPTSCCDNSEYVTYIFPSSLTLNSGMNYTVYFFTSGGNATNGYLINYVGTNNLAPASIVNSQSWGGTRNVLVSSTAGGVPATKTSYQDISFYFTLGAITTVTTTTVTSTTTSTTRTMSVICYPPPISNRQYTFFDGFETGNFSKWNATASGGSSSVTVSSLHPINGTYSMNVSVGGGANQYGYAQGKDNLTALGNNYWFSWYDRIETIQHVANKHVYLLSLRNTTGSFARFGIFHEGTSEHELNIEVYDPNLGTLESLSTDIMLVNNATNHLEFHLFKNATGGYAEGYLNGTAVVHLHLGKSDYPAYTLDVFRVGSTLASQISSFNMQVDNVAVDGSRIGQDPFSCVGYSTSVKIIPLQTQITPNNLFLLILSPLIIIPFLILYSQKRRKQVGH